MSAGARSLADRVAAHVRDIPDFPKPGILFKDITPVLLEPRLFQDAIALIGDDLGRVDRIVGMESRGFIFGAALVDRLSAGLVLARKKGKLPFATISVAYGLEYGSDTLEVHVDAIRPGDRVLVVDDLLATGGTAHATIELARKAGGVVVGATFLIELGFLDGRSRLDVPVRSLLTVG